MVQRRRSAQRAAPMTSWRETVQKQEQRWPLPSVCGPSGPQRRRRCVRMRASSPRIPSSRKVVERVPFTSSSSLKRKWAQWERIARIRLSVCPLSCNSQRESCCIRDKWELGMFRLCVLLPTWERLSCWSGSKWRVERKLYLFDPAHTEKLKDPSCSHLLQTLPCCFCVYTTSQNNMLEKSEPERSLFFRVSSWKAAQVDVSNRKQTSSHMPWTKY